MKPIIIVAIIGVIIVIAAGLSISSENSASVDLKPWAGMDCNEMLDYSGTAEHNLMDDTMHIEFHQFYMDSCTDMKMEESTKTSSPSEICSGIARCMEGTVTKIIDGDTIHVDGESVRFALSSAPELKGFGGVESRDFIDTICPVGSNVLVDEDDGQTSGSFGRVIGVIYCNGVNLNSELLDAGLGFLEERFCDSSEFAEESWAIKHGC